MNSLAKLRHELDHITDPPADAGLDWLDQQIQVMMELAKKLPHEITLHTRSTTATSKLNCFMFALGITADDIREWCSDDIFLGASFLDHLLKTKLADNEVPQDKADDKNVIVYFENALPTHAGKIIGNKVVSKWGAGRTHIWQHNIFEVPARYGDKVRMFKPISIKNAIDAYLEWASTKIRGK